MSTALLILLTTAIATTSANILTNTNEQEGRRHRLINHRNSQRIQLDNGEDTALPIPNDNASRRRSRRKLQQQWTMLQAHDTIDIVNDYKYDEDIIGQQQRLKKRPPDRLIPPIVQNVERGDDNDVEVSSGFRNKRPLVSPTSTAPTSRPSSDEQSSTMIDVQSTAIDQPVPSNIINPNKKLNNKFGEELSGKIISREYYNNNPLIDINLDKFINNKREPPTSAPSSLPSIPGIVAEDTIIITNGDTNKEEDTLQEEQYIKSSSRGSHTTVQIKGNATGTIDIRTVSRGRGKESTIFTMNVKGLDTHCDNMEWNSSNDYNWDTGKSGKSNSIVKKKTTKSSKSSKSKSSKSSKSKSSKSSKCSKQYKWREWNESMSIWSFDDHWECSKSSKRKSSKSKGSKAKGSKSKGAKSKSPKRSKGSTNDGHGSCLCGQCTQDGECNFQGHGHAKPQILYLKVDPTLCPGEVDNNNLCIGTKEHITISFKGNDECTYTINTLSDINILGLYRIAKPAICQSTNNNNSGSKANKKNGVGTNVYIDYIGDSSPDTFIHASCSVDIYEGMRIGESPFILAGYCLENDNEGVEGSCSFIDQPKCSGYDGEKEDDPEEEEDDDWNQWDDDTWIDDTMWDETNWPTWSPSTWEWPTYSPSIWNDDTWGNWDDDNWHDTDWPTYSPSIWDDDGWWDDDKWVDDDDEDNNDDDAFAYSNSPSKAPISKSSDEPTSSPSCPHEMRRLSTGECTPVGTSEPTSNSPTPAVKSQTKSPTTGDGDDDGVDVPDTSSPTIPQPPPTNDTQEPTPSPEEQSTPKPIWTFPKNPRPKSPPPTEIDNTNSPSKFPSTQTDPTKSPSTNSPIGDGVLSKTPTINEEPSLQPTVEESPSTKSPVGDEVSTKSPTYEPDSSDSPTKDKTTSSPAPESPSKSPVNVSSSPSTSDTKLPSTDSPSTVEPTDNSQPTLQPIIGDTKSPSNKSMSPSSDDSKSPTLPPSKVEDSKSPTTKSPTTEEVLTSSPTGASSESSEPTPKPILKPPPTVRSRPTSSPMQDESSAPTELMPSKQPTSTSSSPTIVQSSPSQNPVTKSPIGDGVVSSPPTLVATSKPTLPKQSSSPTLQPSSDESPINSKSPSTSPVINGEPSRTPTMEPSEQPTVKTPRAATPQPTTSPSSEPTVSIRLCSYLCLSFISH